MLLADFIYLRSLVKPALYEDILMPGRHLYSSVEYANSVWNGSLPLLPQAERGLTIACGGQ